jgi:16S rRNA (cytidine1402-2'-O)-methyltransferase
VLVPNTLDFGVDAASGETLAPLTEVLPLSVIQCAAGLRHWVAENAKTTRAFLKRVHRIQALAAPLQEIDIRELPRPPKGAPRATDPGAFKALLQPALHGADLGLISEAGLPAVADPGNGLVQAAHDAGLEVICLPGPSALLLALAASGLNGQSFAFAGYVPVDAQERLYTLQALEQRSARSHQTQLLIETPYRNPALLSALLQALKPGTRLSISVGLTLPTGWSRTQRVADWRAGTLSLPTDIPAVFAFLA